MDERSYIELKREEIKIGNTLYHFDGINYLEVNIVGMKRKKERFPGDKNKRRGIEYAFVTKGGNLVWKFISDITKNTEFYKLKEDLVSKVA